MTDAKLRAAEIVNHEAMDFVNWYSECEREWLIDAIAAAIEAEKDRLEVAIEALEAIASADVTKVKSWDGVAPMGATFMSLARETLNKLK